MLYKKNTSPALSEELFKSPTSEYRGTPFWAWNDELTPEELSRQIDVFREMGFGGFHMHVRTGLKNKYLSDEYMELIRHCVGKAKSDSMLAWLYDEDRWPSGAAGGMVTRDNESYRAKNLLFTDMLEFSGKPDIGRNDGSARNGGGRLLACYDIVLNEDGTLKAYNRIDKDGEVKGRKWYAFAETSRPSYWYNNGTYIDALNPEAVKRFVEVTHERYRETVGDEFDKTVPAIFSDEPQMVRKRMLADAFGKNCNVTMPWTDSMEEKYKERYGEDILDTLPEIIWDTRGVSLARYRYHDFTADLFVSAFADTVGGWCDKNGLALTGHLDDEPTLSSQTSAVGDAMRSYRSFTIPGIDMLCNNHEFTTAKQAQSAAHQYGREGVLSELYGVTSWDCDFRIYKHQGDWQAALGVTVRVPHLAWYGMEGEAKRDYPASISYQSPWYEKYSAIEDHFARVNTALTRGKPVVKVAVVHPVESFWLYWGPNNTSGLIREDMDERFKNVTEWLLGGSIDFDFICESELPYLCEKGGAPLKVGKMSYDAVILPANETLRSTTYDRLEAFVNEGGHLYIMGKAPTLCDAIPSDRGAHLAEKAKNIEFSRAALLKALDCEREVSIYFGGGKLAGNISDEYIYQLREDNGAKWLFVAHTREPNSPDTDGSQILKISVKGEYAVKKYDTENGTILPWQGETHDGVTDIFVELYGYDSALFCLEKGGNKIESRSAAQKKAAETDGKKLFGNTVKYRLSEDNVLLLDFAEFKFASDKEFSPREEILRLDNILRDRLSLPHRSGKVVQPYAIEDEAISEHAVIRFTFDSEIEYEGASLALEDAAETEIVFNGEKVDNTVTGNYVDIKIGKVRLSKIKKGVNELILTKPFGARKNIENVFILGKFGVRITGSEATVTALPESIPFGDLTRYGFPFYGGNITYLLPFETKTGNVNICSSFYRGALQSAAVDGEEKGNIIYPPYTLSLTGLTPGQHELELTLYIHRYNTFGPLHLSDEKARWYGPDAWRSVDRAWSDEYILRRTGVLKHPEIS